jgi:glutaminyl-peptide cyclotransferase
MRPATSSANARPTGQTLLLAASIAGSCALVGYFLFFHAPGATALSAVESKSRLTLSDIPFNGERAYEYLNELCALGPRVSGSPGMQAQQELLAAHFRRLGATVRLQKFRIRHPEDGTPVSMANLIVEWHPDRAERVLLCTHYDTRPFPDQDRRDRRGPFLGANDGASGTALLMELGRQVPDMKGKLGVDFVFFDAEEFIFQDRRDPYFVGSEYFATQHAQQAPAYRYRWAVLLDMVGDADLQIYPDRYSMSWDDSRPLVEAIWATARKLGVREFVLNKRVEILDDHLKLHDIAKIPSCDIIDFNYPAWHTQADRPDRCSALSLAKVGWVVEEWLKQAIRK